MPPVVVVLIALAAVLHATWNVMLKTSGDPLVTSGRAMIAGTLLGLPFVAVGWFVVGQPAVPPEAWVLGVASGLVEVVYLVLLSAAYRRGDLSVVYPIARGTAPLIAVVTGVTILGERLAPGAALALAVLIAGLILVQRPWRLIDAARGLRGTRGPGARGAVPWALACGVSIATYSTIDRVGARLTEPWIFAAILFSVCAVGMWAWIRFVDRAARAANAVGPSWARATVAGSFAVATYVLILIAYSIAPLSVVSPLRESAIVLVSGWGSFRLAEAVTRRDGLARVGGAALIVLGGVLLAAAPAT